VRAVFKSRAEESAAMGAPAIHFFQILLIFLPYLMNAPLTLLAHEKGFPCFHPQHRYEKQVQIMIHPFKICQGQTAHGAPSGFMIQHLDFWRNTANKKH
jgi:hypothetical protein